LQQKFCGHGISSDKLRCNVPEQAARIPQPGWLLVGQISGYLASEAVAAAKYYFGSTANNRSKDDTIAEIAKAP
jgi:hypothetical protein